MKNLLIFLVCIILINACKKETHTQIEIKKAEPLTIQDVELERWKESLKREIFTIDVSQTPNPFISPKTHKLLARNEEIIPLELVGIVDKNGQKIALLQDATKKGYILKKGDKIGNSYIKEIGNDYLIIEETVEDFLGRKSKRLRKIPLRKGVINE